MAIGLEKLICNGKLNKFILFILRTGDLVRDSISVTFTYLKNIWKEEGNIPYRWQQK